MQKARKSSKKIKGSLLSLLQWVWSGIWKFITILFWLLTQLVELLAWAASELSRGLGEAFGTLKKAAVRRNFEVLLSPLQGLLVLIWQLVVASFWLFIQLIESNAWYLSALVKVIKQTPNLGNLWRRPSPAQPASPKTHSSKALAPNTDNQEKAKITKKAKIAVKTALLYGLVGLVLLSVAGVAAIALLPATQVFEADLVVRELSFHYVGIKNPNKRFLQEIRGLEQLTVTGQQRFVLAGTFQSEGDPRLEELNRITVELPSDRSQWSATPARQGTIEGTIYELDPEELRSSGLTSARERETSRLNSKLNLKELRLRRNTRVLGLSYDSALRRLSLTLQPDIRANSLQLSLGSEPLQVTLTDYRIPELEARDSLPGFAPPKSLEFTFIPDKGELSLSLPERTSLVGILPKDETNANTSQWLQGNLDVSEVWFEELGSYDRLNPEANRSTILEGRVRMAGRSLQLEKHQFLIAGKPGIQRLRYLGMIPEGQSLLEVRLAGKAKRIQVALDRDFPVASIQSSILEQWLSRNRINN